MKRYMELAALVLKKALVVHTKLYRQFCRRCLVGSGGSSMRCSGWASPIAIGLYPVTAHIASASRSPPRQLVYTHLACEFTAAQPIGSVHG